MKSDDDRREQFLTHLSGCELPLRAFICGALAAVSEREDLFQEVVYTLWRTYDRYDGARPFLPWAMGVAVRRTKEEYRRSSRRPGLAAAEQLDRLANELASAPQSPTDEEEALAECLAGLPDHAARLVHRRYYEQAGIESLAEEMRQSPAAIYQTLSRLRRQLGQCIRQRLSRAATANHL